MSDYGQEKTQCLDRAFGRLADRYGDEAEQIVRIFAEEIGGLRLTFPGLGDLERRQRDVRIKVLFRGHNAEEIGMRFGLSASHVRRIAAKK